MKQQWINLYIALFRLSQMINNWRHRMIVKANMVRTATTIQSVLYEVLGQYLYTLWKDLEVPVLYFHLIWRKKKKKWGWQTLHSILHSVVKKPSKITLLKYFKSFIKHNIYKSFILQFDNFSRCDLYFNKNYTR